MVPKSVEVVGKRVGGGEVVVRGKGAACGPRGSDGWLGIA